ncbi:hypothetical protein ASPWEDRAFT_379276 [Aspergillus wentii DTO 134E9]|uniref:Uncharacterized protein n=1 Tax=Aspergillus wentii DTO 134E9 TaxID=1073089 RepID=A0A1L9RX96_ASPWE|nr:uncharacterized protein ASPWEDRAFT_379276 [Aspergillus wentii DTO 134E9]OJJ39549.1 hypothetical protein ASPWEDRAFT_379276 [Aspergillus wentii DTO 134E9]
MVLNECALGDSKDVVCILMINHSKRISYFKAGLTTFGTINEATDLAIPNILCLDVYKILMIWSGGPWWCFAVAQKPLSWSAGSKPPSQRRLPGMPSTAPVHQEDILIHICMDVKIKSDDDHACQSRSEQAAPRVSLSRSAGMQPTLRSPVNPDPSLPPKHQQLAYSTKPKTKSIKLIIFFDCRVIFRAMILTWSDAVPGCLVVAGTLLPYSTFRHSPGTSNAG